MLQRAGTRPAARRVLPLYIMNPASIRLTYRQLIDHTASSEFEKAIFEDSYAELLMQAQRYNKDNQFTRLRDIIGHDPKANSLHYKVGFAVGLYIRQLNQSVPGLTDTLGNLAIPFSEYAFALVDSDLSHKQQHLVSITYISGPLLFFGSVGNNLIVSSDNVSVLEQQGWASTFLLPLYEGLTISEYRPAPASTPDEQSIVYHTTPATT